MSLSPQSVVIASRQQLSSLLGGEAVILGLKDGTYYGLDAVGARVWELLQKPRPVREILGLLLDEHEVEAARCENDLLALLKTLQKAGLIEVSGGPPA